MKSFLILPIILILLVSGCAQQPAISSATISPAPTGTNKTTQPTVPVMALKLISQDFENNGKIPDKFTCDGDDKAPTLMISGVPKNAKSLVLIVDDPDAMKPAGKIWVHWLVWDIDPRAPGISGDYGLPPGSIQGTTDFGRVGYGGPCPPDGEHRYFFKLYALDIEELDLPAEWPAHVDAPGSSKATKTDLEKAMSGHILEKAELVGKYERQ